MSVIRNVTTPLGSRARSAAAGAGLVRVAALHEPALAHASSGSCASTAASSSRSRSPGSMPKLLDQRPARVLVGLEGVRLAVGSVEREHQLRAQPLPVRVLVDEPLQLADHLGVAAQRELGLDRTARPQPRRRSSSRAISRLGERLVREVRERRARARARARSRAPRAPVAGRSAASSALAYFEQPLEPLCVELVRIDLRARSRARGSRARPPAAPCAASTRAPAAS